MLLLLFVESFLSLFLSFIFSIRESIAIRFLYEAQTILTVTVLDVNNLMEIDKKN